MDVFLCALQEMKGNGGGEIRFRSLQHFFLEKPTRLFVVAIVKEGKKPLPSFFYIQLL